MPDIWPHQNADGDDLFSAYIDRDQVIEQQLRKLRSADAALIPQSPFDQLVDDPRAWFAAAFYASAAYRAASFDFELSEWLETRITTWHHKSMEGFCAELERFDVVAIAGSNDWTDWKKNRKWSRAPWFVPGLGDVQLHSGFVDLAEVAQYALEPWFRRRAGRPILFIGHSMGAAVAQMLMAHREWTEGPVAAIVFASPRVGGADFARECEAHWMTHLWNVGDFVPHLPPFLSGYRHPRNKARYVARDGSIYRGRSAVWGDVLVNTLRQFGMLPKPGLKYCFSAIEAHSLNSSIARLARWSG